MNTISLSPESVSDILSDGTMQSVQISQMSFPEDLWRNEKGEDSSAQFHLNWPPVVVMRMDSGGFRIIDGCKRVISHSEGEAKESVCLAIEPQSDAVCGLIRIMLNRSRTLSRVEKLLFSRFLSVTLNREDYLDWVRKLGISDKEKFELEKVFTADEELLKAVEQGFLDISSAGDLIHFSSEDRNVILEFFSRVSFSRQMQRELIEWIPEIAFRNETAVKSLLHDETIGAILENENLNMPQKSQKIRNELYMQRFPFYSSMQKNWKSKAASANPHPSKVQFSPSPGFEKRKLDVKITVKSAADARKILDDLASLPSHTWEELIFPH
ncbi:MAG: hypothetical protein ACLFVE_06945 [Chitinispirillaceae bacterium]